jgi:hypothetical protein
MNRILSTFAVGAVLFGFTLGGCSGGSGAQPASTAKVTAAVSASARELESQPETESEQDHDRMVSRFMTVLNQLRALPALAPLFDAYQVQNPVVIEDDDLSAGLIDLLHAVRITVLSGSVTITNRETGAEIFSGPLSDLASGVFHPENLPGGTPPPPSACTYAYSAWGACQPTGTQSRTVASATPAGCTGTPVLAQACTYTAPPPPPVTTCTGFTYSTWGACQPSNTQTRTLMSSTPAGCTGGSPVLTQACTYTPPVTTCSAFTYSAWGTCQSNSTQTRTALSSSPAGCTGGSPVLTQACTYTPPVTTCSAFTYSAWGTCQSNNTQTRTVLSSSPAGCTGGTPSLTQACVYTAPIDGAALYGQKCAGCHGALATSNLKGKNISVSSIKSFGMTQGLNDAQLQAIVTAVGP